MKAESKDNSKIKNRYTIKERIGKGGYSKVYLAEDEINKKLYAIKVLNENNESFENKIKIQKQISSINNPYIINLIDFGESLIKIESTKNENKQFAVLEYCSKGELYNYILNSENGLEEKYAKLIFKKILLGVQSIHNLGICHRDLKMENILLDDSFNPKICDFGFATEIKGKDGSGKLSDFLGTKNYAAPEIFLNKEYDGIKVDIFSLGVILLNLVTCKIGFVKATLDDKYYKNIIFRNYILYWKLLKNHIGEISNELKELYLKMVDYNPDKRPNIEAILKDPWMKEINDLNDEEYKKLENEVYNKFKELEVDVISKMEED